MHLDRVDHVLEFALLVAGRADEYQDRFLGPIHLIKYVYLADLAFAERNSGETYTRIPWRFFHFGPWAGEVNDRIKVVTNQVDVVEQTFESKYGDDRTMWSMNDEEAFERVEQSLHVHVSLTVKRMVQKFGHDTVGLLHFVYLTPPMLRASPGETLDFHVAPPEGVAEPVRRPPMSERQRKKRAERIREGRELLKKKLEAPVTATMVTPQPRYDEVFDQGVAWLEALAGEPLSVRAGEVLVDESVWKSPARGDRHDE